MARSSSERQAQDIVGGSMEDTRAEMPSTQEEAYVAGVVLAADRDAKLLQLRTACWSGAIIVCLAVISFFVAAMWGG